MAEKRPLQVNPEPVKAVPKEQREVWTKRPGLRCEHEDRRGRCTSRETRGYWNPSEKRAEFYCERHPRVMGLVRDALAERPEVPPR